VEGFLAAGHAATVTGWGIFEPFAKRFGIPVVVAGFEPLDILAGIVKLLELVQEGRAEVANAFPRCVTREGNLNAQRQLWRVFEAESGVWRGIATVPGGNLRLRSELSRLDARRRLDLSMPADSAQMSWLAASCICGSIMVGSSSPLDCPLFGRECVPEAPVGACMVSSEGACRIWHTYGGRPSV
jgi:hydrogenase expression/formation protein HypD